MFRRITIVTLFVALGFVAGLVLTGRMQSAGESAAAPQAQRPDEAATSAAAQQGRQGAAAAPAAPAGLPDLTGVAQRAIDSVTNISSTNIVRRPISPFANDPFFRFFDRGDLWREQREQSLGSGVVVSADGYVLTNQHVVGEAGAEVVVALTDKREMRARVVGIDDWTDIAVLKVDAQNLRTLTWGDSSKLRVAEWVLAIGNPFQLNQTVTLGIVSATGRSLEGRLATYEDFIQTDAAINPGNSGGALINARGELVGINTAIFSQSGGYQGIGFAVPSNLVRHVMNDLIEYGAVRRGTITGIELQQLTEYAARQLGAPSTRGALVRNVSQRSEAFQAGLRQFDIITSFNDAPIEDAYQFLRMLADAKVGSTAKLGVLRQGRKLSVEITVEQTGARRRV
jgi:Do/DeqQ family serine protease